MKYDKLNDYSAEIAAEECRVERLMTVGEIFAEGFKVGLSKAGLTENADREYREWLLARCEPYSRTLEAKRTAK